MVNRMFKELYIADIREIYDFKVLININISINNPL